MARSQSKTLAPLLILRILEERSDEQHPITREEVSRILEEEYGITMERKSFFRHIQHLKELDGVDIHRVTVKAKDSDTKVCAGFYLADRLFTEMELRVIIDALSGSRYLSQWETEDLVARLSQLSTRNFRKKIAAYQFVARGNKTSNETLMLNLEIIDEALVSHKQIRFTLLRTESDGSKVPSDWRNEVCTPVRYFVKDHAYYLVGVHTFREKLLTVSYKLSDMVNVEVLDAPAEDIRSIPEFRHGVDWQKFLREHPALENLRGKTELCTFLCYRWMLDDIKSFFGDDLRIRQLSQEENNAVADFLPGTAKKMLVEVSVITDPFAAMHFAWYHPEGIWLIAPQSATRSLRFRLHSQQQKYEKLKKLYK